MEISEILEYFIQYAHLPAVPIIAWIAQKIKSIKDFGSYHFLVPIAIGLTFGVGQKYVYPLLDKVALEPDLGRALLMGLGTGVAAMGVRALYKGFKKSH